MRYTLLDIETVERDTSDVAIVTTMASGEHVPNFWYRTRRSGLLWSRVKPTTMRVKDIQRVLDYMEEQHRAGSQILTHNGTSHDLRILAKAGKRPKTVEAIALAGYDIAFQMMCLYGFPISLRNVALGFNIKGKFDMQGSSFGDAWQLEDFDSCFEYASRDVALLGEIVERIRSGGIIRWVDTSKKRNSREFRRLLTVRECLALPLPKITGEFSSAWSRKQFVDWMRSVGV